MARTSGLLTADDVAEILKVTPRTVRRWATAGMLERVPLGGRLVRYTPQSVHELIQPKAHQHHQERPSREFDQGAHKLTDDGGQHGTVQDSLAC